MMCKVKGIALGLGVMFTFSVLWVFRPYEKTDPRMVDLRLRALEEPYQKMESGCFGDGGSIGLRIVDRTGKTLAFCLPAPMDKPSFSYKKLFIGSIYYTEPGSSEVLNAHHTRLRLAELLRAQSRVDANSDILVYRLSGRWRDSLRYLIREYIFRVYVY